jgi:hypothetical protein
MFPAMGIFLPQVQQIITVMVLHGAKTFQQNVLLRALQLMAFMLRKIVFVRTAPWSVEQRRWLRQKPQRGAPTTALSVVVLSREEPSTTNGMLRARLL